MKPTDQPDPDHPDDAAADAGTKKAYVKPAFQHERAFETMALACGKVGTTTQQCRNNRKNS
jgi:hypothetical protein